MPSVGNYDFNNSCSKCGKPFIYVGDIPPMGFTIGLEPYCTCNIKPNPTPMHGWICSKCGASLSPFTAICPCSNVPYKVTC